jgi:hypothetical protein
MTYLYGDSTPSSLRDNFLEFLRDAVDFSVYVLQADSRIQVGRAHMEELRQQATLELGQLEAFGQAVALAIEDAPKGAGDSPAVACSARLTSLTVDAVRTSMQAVRDRLAADIAQAEAEEAVERDGCHRALETLLIPHDPPDASSVIRLVRDLAGGYSATAEGSSELGLGWRLALEVPQGHPFGLPVTVERLMPQFQLQAPELTGWIRKEVKVRAQRLDRYTITEVVDDGSSIAIKLRTDGDAGFDLEVYLTVRGVTISRVSPTDDAASGKFEPDEADIAKLVELGKMVHSALGSLVRKRLTDAKVDETQFRKLESFVPMVDRLVAALAPICKEISRRSLEPTEMVLRKLLANDRREEIFVAKSTLLDKLSPLTDEERALFEPLGLDPALASLSALPPAPIRVATHRSELPPSQPPRPPAKPDIRAEKPQPPPPVPYISEPPRDRDSKPEVSIGDTSDDDDDLLEEVEPANAAPDSTELRQSGARNPEIRAALERIMLLAKEGSTDEAYREYGALFSSRAFADNPLEDRRRLLRLLLLAKPPAAATDAFRAAHAAARDRLTVLVDRLGDPRDYELLGICHLVLEDNGAASAAFKKALDIERGRDPQSELCGTLMRRIAAV